MTAIKDAAAEFLSHRRVAVTGVSHSRDHGSNAVYTRLRDRGYEVFAVNPNANEVAGDTAYHSLSAIPGGVEADLGHKAMRLVFTLNGNVPRQI